MFPYCVGESTDEVDGRRIRSLQILYHQQQRRLFAGAQDCLANRQRHEITGDWRTLGLLFLALSRLAQKLKQLRQPPGRLDTGDSEPVQQYGLLLRRVPTRKVEQVDQQFPKGIKRRLATISISAGARDAKPIATRGQKTVDQRCLSDPRFANQSNASRPSPSMAASSSAESVPITACRPMNIGSAAAPLNPRADGNKQVNFNRVDEASHRRVAKPVGSKSGPESTPLLSN